MIGILCFAQKMFFINFKPLFQQPQNPHSGAVIRRIACCPVVYSHYFQMLSLTKTKIPILDSSVHTKHYSVCAFLEALPPPH